MEDGKVKYRPGRELEEARKGWTKRKLGAGSLERNKENGEEERRERRVCLDR
jgi:hypothetical protein